MQNTLAVSIFMSLLGLTLLGCFVLLTTLHELGHALAALVLQAGRVTLYLGSHGRTAGGGRGQLGRLRVYFRYNPLRLAVGGGLCRAQYPMQTNRQIWRTLVYVLAGPLLPLAVAGLALFVVLHQSPPLINAIKVLASLFFGITLLSAIGNLRPHHRAITLPSGRLTHNDGTAIRQLLRHGSLVRSIRAAKAYYAAGDYARYAQLTELLLDRMQPQVALFRELMQAHWLLRNYAAVLAVSRRFEQLLAPDFNNDDRFAQALALSYLGQHALATTLYSALIAQDNPPGVAYSHRGYTYSLLGKYELALADFEQALLIEPDGAYTLSHRGLARLKLGQEAAGLADLARSLELDPQEAYGYRNLGIYHLDRGEHAAALAFFEQAHGLNPHAHLLADYLRQTRQLLEADSRSDGRATI